MGHDQLFKDLLRAYFADFLALAAPESTARLDLARLRFLDTEVFTASPEGARRQLDLLAEIPFLRPGPGAETGLVHVEIEARARPGIGPRLAGYAMQVWLRHGKPLLSLLLTLRGGAPGLRVGSMIEDRMGFETFAFRYRTLHLEKSRPADYLGRPEPLAWALAALMRPEGRRAAHKLACLRPIAAAARLTGTERFLLVNCVETYLKLNPEEAAEYQALQAAEDNREVREMAKTWADEMIAKGRVEGREEGRVEGREEGRVKGREEGRTEGREEGMAEGARAVLLRLLGRRFGPLPEAVRRRVEAISSPAALERLAEQVLVASSLDEMGLA